MAMNHRGTQDTIELHATTGQRQVKSGSVFRKKPILVTAIIFVLAILIICGAFFYNDKHLGQAAKGGENSKPYRSGPIHSFEPFIVNVSGTNATRYLRISVSVECSSKKAHTRMIENELRIRDRILDLLCAQSIEELLDVSRRDRLRAQVGVKIGEALGNSDDSSEWVRSVYFSEFTIQ